MPKLTNNMLLKIIDPKKDLGEYFKILKYAFPKNAIPLSWKKRLIDNAEAGYWGKPFYAEYRAVTDGDRLWNSMRYSLNPRRDYPDFTVFEVNGFLELLKERDKKYAEIRKAK